MLGPILLTAIAVGALLFFEHRGLRGGVWIAKPVASTAFLWAAAANGGFSAAAHGDPYAVGIVAGLVLSWWGDVLLIPLDRPSVFQTGIAAFLLGHVAFAGAFVSRSLDAGYTTLATVVLAIPIAGVLRWLRPHVPPDLRIAVHAYVVVITAMMVAAIGAVGAGAPVTLLVGATMFYLSDLSVARDRFVAPGFVNGAWGLPLYYGAQLVLASTLGG